MSTTNPWSRISKLLRPDLIMFIKWNSVAAISDPTQSLPTPQNLSLSLLSSGHVCQTVLWGESYECYPCEFDIFSEHSKILGSELQGNYCDASCLTVKLIRAEKPWLYLLSVFPVGLIARKWKTRVCVLLLGVNTSVCVHVNVHVVYFCSAHFQQWRSRNECVAKPQIYSKQPTAYFSKLMWNVQQRNSSGVENVCHC